MIDEVPQRAGHETRDISVRVVACFAAGLVAAGMVIVFALGGLYKLFEQQHPSPDAPSRIALHPGMIAPLPRLQTDPAADLAASRVAEEARLRAYGWIDRPAGVIHIPIERAMDLIAERGLPTRGPGAQNASDKTPVQMRQDKAAATKP